MSAPINNKAERLQLALDDARATLELAKGNLSSLMAAYPERFPRHAFQGTYDSVCAALAREMHRKAQRATVQAVIRRSKVHRYGSQP